MLFDYANIGMFFLVAALFVFAALVAGRFIRPSLLYKKKLETYECGEAPIGQAWFNFNPRFYIVAIIYIIFDIEIAFIYPVAAVFKQWVAQGVGLFALVEILAFVAILLLGLAYVWVKGDLAWIRTLRTDVAGTLRAGPPGVANTKAAATKTSAKTDAKTSGKASTKADAKASGKLGGKAAGAGISSHAALQES